MRLSEAIRLGAMLKPQGHGELVHHGRTCALGAALDAVGALCSDYDAVGIRFPITRQVRLGLCPAPGCENYAHGHATVMETVFYLNDSHDWTRERIADWVETLEGPQEAASVDQSVEADITAAGREEGLIND